MKNINDREMVKINAPEYQIHDLSKMLMMKYFHEP